MCGVLLTLALTTLVLAQPMSFQYIYDDLGQLIKVIDSTGTVIEYVYDPVGNLLEIKRSTLTGLAIHSFTPQQGVVGTRVTLQGQGFSTTPADNTVQFHGTAAPVSAATPTSLTVTVPPGATTGRITVTIAATTATSDRDFTILQVPVIMSVNPRFTFSGSVIPSFQIQGTNLTGATFAFAPAFVPPAIAIDAVSIVPGGTSASLSLTVRANTVGQFTIVATNAVGSSDAFPSLANTLYILSSPAGDDDRDGLTNADELARGTDPINPDTDRDGFPDAFEVEVGSNPLDPNSVPNIHPPGEVVGVTLALLNTTHPSPLPSTAEAVSLPLALANLLNPQQDSDGDGFSDLAEVSAGTDPFDPHSVPNTPPLPAEAVGTTFALVNGTNPSQPQPVSETVGPVFSVENLP